jgi:hypothetical protein
MTKRPSLSIWLTCSAALVLCPGTSRANEIRPFLEEHCFDCHDTSTKKGGLDLASMSFNPEERGQFETWVFKR